MKMDSRIASVIDETQQRIDIVRSMYQNDVTLPYDEQPMSQLRGVVLKLHRHYFKSMTDSHPVTYWTSPIVVGWNSITNICKFLKDNDVCYDGVPLHTKISGHHRFSGSTGRRQWGEHEMGGCVFFTREYTPQWRCVFDDIWLRDHPVWNSWEIAKCDFTLDEYEHVRNLLMITNGELYSTFESMLGYDLIQPSVLTSEVRVGYDYKFASRVHKWNHRRAVAGSYKDIQPHKEKIIQLGVDYLTELWNNRNCDITLPMLMKYFNTIPLLTNWQQYATTGSDMATFLSSNKRIDSYDGLIECNKFVNDVATEIMSRLEQLGCLDM